MTTHYGKRNPGALTAASPGDTLYIPLNFYNDSGASISIGNTLVVGDIEVFKNGSVTQRSTDSGYAILGDTGNFDNRIGFKGISISLFNTADDSTFYAVGSTYWVAIDSVTVDGRTVRFFPAVFEIGETRANVVQIDGDTGAADQLQKAFASGFADTGINQRLGQILSDVDTGLRAQISDVDTGLHDTIADLDTGLRGILVTTGVNLGLIRGDTGGADRFYRYTQKLDTGGDATVSASVDTGQVNQAVWQADAQRKLTVDTGIADQVWKTATAGYADDTGTFGELLRVSATASVDTGQVNQAVWQANAARGITAIADTGMNERLARIQSDVDTGLRVHIDDLDTGLHAHISDVDTGIHSILQTVGVLVVAFSDTGVNNRLAVIAADTDTGIQSSVNVTSFADTGVNERLTAIETQTAKLTFDTGNEILADIRKVNAVTVQGIGDTGTANTWRPGT
jgi:hypothetical protein